MALEAKAKSLGVPLYVLNEGSVMGLYFTTTKPRPGSELPNPDLVDRFHLACLNHGVQMGPGGMVSMATAITDKALEEAREGMSAALEEIAP
jgi:glutamate-1-semialdehyde aminotransferase